MEKILCIRMPIAVGVVGVCTRSMLRNAGAETAAVVEGRSTSECASARHCSALALGTALLPLVCRRCAG